MNLILKNPYRTVGLLVGATAKEQTKQISRLKKYIEAEQEPQDDFSFPTLGHLQRTLNSVEEAASKLNLDIDKINAALFWFWNGNPITDEAAFEALKSGETETAIEIWKKLVFNSEEEYNQVSKRNASAFHNLSTLYLTEYGIDEDTLELKLRFLESDFVNEFTSKATDETFKTTKKDLQLLFLKGISQIEDFDTSQFLEAISDVEFIAKSEFLKSFVQKPIEQIEQKIETAKNKRKASKANAAKVGQELFTATASDLTQLKNIVGTSDIKYTSVVDKIANEILQCSIDYFNDSQEKDSSSDYAKTAMKLAKQAQGIAVGNLTKDRVKDSINTLAEMIDRELSQAIDLLQSVKDAYKTNEKQIYAQIAKQGLDINRINFSKLAQLIENSLDWNKVVELIQEVIPPKNVEKIKKVNNPTKLNEYKTLVNFLMSKVSYSYKNKVGYICYWETPKTTNSTSSSTSTYRPVTKSSSLLTSFNDYWIFWVLGIAVVLGIIIGATNDGHWIAGGLSGFLIAMVLIGWLSD